jgi:tetratricopeptide (TPR) repeat protein
MRRCILSITVSLLAAASAFAAFSAKDLEDARDRQDRTALQSVTEKLAAEASKQPSNPDALYRLGLAKSYLAEVALELKDKILSRTTAEEGIQAAQKLVDLRPNDAEAHRLLGTLCGQVVPAAGALGGLKWGKCALDEIDKAISLDPKNAQAYVSRGVGNYYLPPTFGGGVDKAIGDFQKAIQLNPKLGEAYLWLGIAYRKENKNAEAHEALAKAQALNPQRIWTKQQLEKTPAK